MLLSFVLENFRSFRGPATLDLQKRSFKTNIPQDRDWSAVTFRRAGVFGPNASGKSNLVGGLGALARAAVSSVQDERYVRGLRQPHSLEKEEATFFEVEYVAEGDRYRWAVEVGNDGILSESLEANLTGHWRRVFERNRDALKFGPRSGISRASQENLEDLLGPWALTLTSMRLLRNVGDHAVASLWWDSLRVVDTDGRLHRDVVELVHSSPKWLKVAREVLRSADFGISDMRVKDEKVPQHVRDLAKKLNAFLRDEIDIPVSPEAVDDLAEVFSYLEFEHNSGEERFSIAEDQESLGTRSWLDTAVLAVQSIVEGNVMIVDEVDTSLHPLLVRALVSYFSDSELNGSGAQIIFTSHDATLMGKYPDPELSPDEAWLVEKDEGASVLIGWSEFQDTRPQHNLEHRYLRGAYGAVPVVDRRRIRAAVTKLREDRGEKH